MKVELRPGLQGRAEAIVDTTNVAAVMGSGDLDVFATPAMIALMEQAACNAILPCLDSSTSSVGIKMDTTHEGATLLGKKIIATAKLIAVEGRKLTFKVGACDDHGRSATVPTSASLLTKLNLLLNYSLSAELFLTKNSRIAGVFCLPAAKALNKRFSCE